VVHPSGSGVSSRVGEVLGTPAYMAPEQARGEVDQLDDRCDVFGLGGILCAVLTGLPPYRGPTMSDYLRQASGVELEDAFTRLDGCGAEPELVHLAKQCLAADREARPRDAGAVAQAVIDYQAGVEERLRRAELERAQAAIEAREERKRRRLAVALAAAVVGLVLVAGGAAWWLERQHARQQEERARREAQTRQAVALALERAEAALRQGNWGEADKALAEAASRMADDGPADLREPLLRLRNDRGRATRLQEISVNRLAGGPSFQVAVAYSDLDRDARKEEVRLDRSVWVEGQFDEARAAAAYAREFAEAGLAELEPGAVAAAVRVSPIRDVWIATLDDWALVEPDVARRARLLQTARQVDPDPWRDQLRDPAVWEDQQALERLAAAISVAEVSPQLLALLSERLAALGGDVLPLLDAAQQQHPTAFRINLLLGKKLIPVTGPEGAAAPGFLRAALVAQPESIAVLNNLAVALYTRRRLDEALIVLDKALRIAPRHAMLHLHRGHVLRDQGWPDEAAGAYEEAARCDPKLVDAPYNLGVVRYAARRFAEAEAAFRTATQVDATYVRAQVLLGLALHAQTKLEEAAVALETARKLQPDSFAVWFHLGMVRYDQRRSDEAIAAFKKAASVAPKHVTVRRFLGQALFQKGQFAEAREVFRGGLELVAPPDPAHKMLTALAARSERLHGLDQKLPEYLRPGASVPSLADQRDLAVLCLMPHRRLYAASARFYGAALDADPKLANNLAAGHLYHAACAAVLAADGQGKDASRLSEAERVHLRKQALGWLRAELDLWTKRVQDRPANQAEIRLALEYRRQDSDLASVRGAGALAKLPASERGDWEKLWADLNALIEKVGGSASDSR
jgi:tetratricopeptide (TPR) repeat protein